MPRTITSVAIRTTQSSRLIERRSHFPFPFPFDPLTIDLLARVLVWDSKRLRLPLPSMTILKIPLTFTTSTCQRASRHNNQSEQRTYFPKLREIFKSIY